MLPRSIADLAGWASVAAPAASCKTVRRTSLQFQLALRVCATGRPLELLQAREDDLAVGSIDPERCELRFVQAEQLAAVYPSAYEQRDVLRQVYVVLEPVSTTAVSPVLDAALCQL